MKIKKYFIFINKIKYFVLELILKKMVNFYMNLHYFYIFLYDVIIIILYAKINIIFSQIQPYINLKFINLFSETLFLRSSMACSYE